ncbi:hypothetical protein UFOVP87_27 [uncultured Caudovirales phage]|uniref:Uncharacterized protein n=1 Tax=uncultured Caudovirales phage TaxID=2100421 RepID=A0A6J5L001_9CAUD|nr:hypothetical protein UFOVP87_27 [uncultured Caudovirales phage]
MTSAQFNKTDKLPDWSINTQNGLVTFESKQLGVKQSVLEYDWLKCTKELNITDEISLYNNLNNICDYFIKLGK